MTLLPFCLILAALAIAGAVCISALWICFRMHKDCCDRLQSRNLGEFKAHEEKPKPRSTPTQEAPRPRPPSPGDRQPAPLTDAEIETIRIADAAEVESMPS